MQICKCYNLVESDNILGFTKDKNDNLIGLCIKNDIILPLTNEERDKIKIEYEYPKVIEKTINKDQEIGLVKICCENNLIFQEKIYTIIDVK